MNKNKKTNELNCTNHIINTVGADASVCPKSHNGITLIALIITIIIMLILVAVTVTIAINGGLFGMAKDATRQTQIAQIRELIQPDILEVQIQNGGSITREELKEVLEKYFTNVPEKLPEDLAEVTLTAKEKYGGYDNIPLTDIYNGEIEDIVLTAKDIAENSSEYFGKEVKGYECPSDGVDSWRIFYADDNNVYLIARDFIACDDYPAGQNGTKVTEDYDQWSVWINAAGDYKGSEDVTDEKLKSLNSMYFKCLTEKNVQDTSHGAQTMAYLLDTDAWSIYMGECAEFAIGGPSIELTLNSINEKYGTSYTILADEGGYFFEDVHDTRSSYDFQLKDVDDDLYFRVGPGDDPVIYTLCCSPCPTRICFFEPAVGLFDEWLWNGTVWSACASSYISVNADGDYRGCRPVVCLKTTTEFEVLDNGDISIVNK